MNLVLKLVAFPVLAVFLAILLWKVPRLDLGVLIAITLILAGRDFVGNAGSRRG